MAKPVGCGVLFAFIVGAIVATIVVQFVVARLVGIDFAFAAGTVAGTFLLINVVAAGIVKGRIVRSRRALRVTLIVIAVEVVLTMGVGIAVAVAQRGVVAAPPVVQSVVTTPTAGGLVRIENTETKGRAASTVDGMRSHGYVDPFAAYYGPVSATEPTVAIFGGRIAHPRAGALGIVIKGEAEGLRATAVDERDYDAGSLSGELRCARLSAEGGDLTAVCVWGDGSTIATSFGLDGASPPELARTLVSMLPDMGAPGR